ncbi:MAG: tyrosine-type recombinase/integrase [Acidiferrobacterales bacterium]
MGQKKSLSAIEIARLHRPGLYAVGGVPGLCLKIKHSLTKSWILRYRIGIQRRDMGLGGYPVVTLAQARERAKEARDRLFRTIDPVTERHTARAKMKAAQARQITFAQAAALYITAHEAGWKSAKHAAQWRATLALYAHPVMGNLSVESIELGHVLRVLEPIWTTKNETASRLRGRIESVLDWCTVRGYRKGDNPARWRGHLDQLLPKPSKVAKVEHHPAIPVSEISAFMKDLRPQQGMGARALEFVTLTAARSGEVRGAAWAEIDLRGAVWTIPAERMKAGKEHRVPLSRQAVALLKSLPRVEGSPFVFPSQSLAPLSDMTLSAVMRRMGVAAVPHGLRSTFRDWCAEHTNYPREVAEQALAHSLPDKVEAAYRRGDLFGKRTLLMQEWADFCDKPLHNEK